jgi:hypothetical protein
MIKHTKFFQVTSVSIKPAVQRLAALLEACGILPSIRHLLVVALHHWFHHLMRNLGIPERHRPHSVRLVIDLENK